MKTMYKKKKKANTRYYCVFALWIKLSTKESQDDPVAKFFKDERGILEQNNYCDKLSNPEIISFKLGKPFYCFGCLIR